MKKSVVILTLLTSTLVLTQTIFAQDITSSTRSGATHPRKEQIQTRIDNRKIVLEDKMMEDKMMALKEKMASREAALKLKLHAFRDQKKATAAARISDNLNKINTNQTSQMQKYLNTMTAILDRLEARVNQPTPDIKDPVKAKLAIADAKTTIASASAAVTGQAQKDYTIQATSEAKIRQEAQDARNNLHTDILGVRRLVIAAKQAVANAIRVAKSGEGIKEGTASGHE